MARNPDQHERLAAMRMDQLISVLNGCMVALAECRADCQRFAEKAAAVAEELRGRLGRGAAGTCDAAARTRTGGAEKGRSDGSLHRAGLRPAGAGDERTVREALREIKTADGRATRGDSDEQRT